MKKSPNPKATRGVWKESSSSSSSPRTKRRRGGCTRQSPFSGRSRIQLAWFGLVNGFLTPEVFQAAQRASVLSNYTEPSILRTLSAVYAEQGQTTEAREVLLKSMDLHDLKEPDSVSWYVFGRIAEQFGVREAAIAYYRKVTPPGPEEQPATSTYSLAQRRLMALGQEAEQ